jgi:hypothetical protein
MERSEQRDMICHRSTNVRRREEVVGRDWPEESRRMEWREQRELICHRRTNVRRREEIVGLIIADEQEGER